MSSELLQTLKQYISQVIDSFYLPLPELGVISIMDKKYFVRLVNQDVLIPFNQCVFSSHLLKENVSIAFQQQYTTTREKEHVHEFPESLPLTSQIQILRSFKDQDQVLVLRLKKGEQFLILCKVVSGEGL